MKKILSLMLVSGAFFMYGATSVVELDGSTVMCKKTGTGSATIDQPLTSTDNTATIQFCVDELTDTTGNLTYSGSLSGFTGTLAIIDSETGNHAALSGKVILGSSSMSNIKDLTAANQYTPIQIADDLTISDTVGFSGGLNAAPIYIDSGKTFDLGGGGSGTLSGSILYFNATDAVLKYSKYEQIGTLPTIDTSNAGLIKLDFDNAAIAHDHGILTILATKVSKVTLMSGNTLTITKAGS